MTIAAAIMKNQTIINREPITLGELLEWVQKKLKKKITNTAVRNIFLGNDDYYKFNYITLKWGVYIPKELNESLNVIKKVAHGRVIKRSGLSLLYQLNLSTQNVAIDTWYIFGIPSTKDLNFLDFFKDIISFKFINIKEKNIKYFTLLTDIFAYSIDDQFLKKYLLENHILRKTILESYKLLLDKTILNQNQQKHVSSENNSSKNNIANWWELKLIPQIEIAILKAVLYAK